VTSEPVSRRFRVEPCVAFTAVSSITVAYFQRQRLQSLDAPVVSFYCIYIIASGLLGYYFARWYRSTHTGMLETISVPIVIPLLAVAISSLMLTIPDVAGEIGDSHTFLERVGGAMRSAAQPGR
jgi:hypothetical protein